VPVLALQVEGVTKSFGRVRALDGVDLEVRAGENFGLVGPNGSGKTTLLRLLAGVLRPGGGTLCVFGMKLPSVAARQLTGYMTQTAALYEDLTVRENVSFFWRLYAGGRGRSLRAKVDEVLELVRLTDRASSPVRTLSGGMRQRTNLACALVHGPRLLLLDEPTVGVDPELRLSLWEHFHRMNATGTTLVVSTHVMDEARRCGRIGLISAGRLIADGTAEELVANAGAADLEAAFLHYARKSRGEGGEAA